MQFTVIHGREPKLFPQRQLADIVRVILPSYRLEQTSATRPPFTPGFRRRSRKTTVARRSYNLVDETGRNAAEKAFTLQQNLGCQIEWWSSEKIKRMFGCFDFTAPAVEQRATVNSSVLSVFKVFMDLFPFKWQELHSPLRTGSWTFFFKRPFCVAE